MCAVVLLDTSAFGYTRRRVGVDSNLLVRGSHVVFAQGTGSLTVLDVNTGQVQLRKKPTDDFWYAGKLQDTPFGVLMIRYSRIALLDQSTFDPIWSAESCQDGSVDGDFVVSHDGNRTITCRDLKTGQEQWTVNMAGSWELRAASGRVVVATSTHFDGQPALRTLDLKTGSELLRHEGRDEDSWVNVYFDGEFVYLITARDNSRDEIPGDIMKFDLQGTPLKSVSFTSSEVVAKFDRAAHDFIFEGKMFLHNGAVRPLYSHEPESLLAEWKLGNRAAESLPGGVLADRLAQDVDGRYGPLMRLRTTGNECVWRVHPSYRRLSKHDHGSSIKEMAQSDGNLLLASHEGYVECLDMASGAPRWLYVFPAINVTMSYSSPYGLPPYLTQQATAYRSDVSRLGETESGSFLLPNDFDIRSENWSELRASAAYAGRIVVDPDPDNPFSGVRNLLIRLAVLGVTPLKAIPLILVLNRISRRESAAWLDTWIAKSYYHLLAVLFSVLSVPPAFGLLMYGRVDRSWTLSLKFVFAAAILVAGCAILRLYAEHRWLFATGLGAILVTWLTFVHPAWWYS